MSEEITFTAEIDEFEPQASVEQIRAEIPIYNKEEYPEIAKIGNLTYPKDFIPAHGWFPAAQLTGSLSLSSTQPDVTSNVTRVGFAVELNTVLANGGALSLQKPKTRMNQGLLFLHESLLPNWLNEEGDSGYMVVILEYNNENTKNQTENTDEELSERRETYQEKFAEWEKNEF